MKIADSLNSLNAYPIPVAKREIICIECGLVSEQELDAEIIKSKAYKKAKAMVYNYLASAPNVTENGITYSFSDTDKKRFARLSAELLSEIGEKKAGAYGYKGESL